MATERIQLTIGGEYTAKDAFTQGNQDLKSYQQAHKDVTQSFQRGINTVAGMFDGEMSNSIRHVSSLLQSLATGGMWGIMNAAITETISYFKKVKDEAEAVKQRIDDIRIAHRRYLDELMAAKQAEEQNGLERIADSAKNAVTQVEKLIASFQSLASAEDAAIGQSGQLAIANINNEFAQKLAEACDELKPVIQAEKALAIAEVEQKNAREQQTRAIEREKTALGDIDHEIELQKKAIKALNDAGMDTTDAYTKLTQLQTKRSEQVQRLKNAETKAEISALEHDTAIKNATAALKKAQIAFDKAVEEQEKENEKIEDLAYLHAQEAKITRVCMNNQVEANAYIKLFKDAMESGATETEAYNKLQEKLNGELKKRAEAEEKAAKEAEKKKKEEQRAFAQSYLHIDPNDVKEGVEDWDGQTTYSKMREQMSKDIAEQKVEQKRMDTEMRPFIDLLKGNMPQKFAEEYQKALMKNFSQDQIIKMYQTALKRQLISSEEQKEQVRTVKDILKTMEKAGLK